MEILSKLFGSDTKVKIMRLFLLNQDKVFDTREIASRVQSSSSRVRMELNTLEKMGLIKKRAVSRKSHSNTFSIDPQFMYLSPLQNFLVNTEPLHTKDIIKKVSRLGVIKLIIVAGVFMQESESRADILIVGDGIKKTSLENAIKGLESEIGKELRYAYFSTDDFKYRLSMFDKLTRDILDYPHRKLINKLGLE